MEQLTKNNIEEILSSLLEEKQIDYIVEEQKEENVSFFDKLEELLNN